MSDSRVLFARGCGGVLSVIALSELFAELNGTGVRPGLWMLIAGLAFAFLTLKISSDSDEPESPEDSN